MKLLRALPGTRRLPEEVWERRHQGVLCLLWIHVPAILAFALFQGVGLVHAVAEASIVVPFAGIAMRTLHLRRLSTTMSSLGLLTCSAILVHLSHGTIEMHFHYFVMVGVVTLYQDWLPFLIAIAYVVTQHTVGGVLSPASVYNHPNAIERPWLWAMYHGVAILAMSITGLLMWKLNETLVGTVEQRELALSAAEADRARLLSEVIDAGERERVRVATELHDGPIQHLARLGYAVDRAMLRLGRSDVDGAALLIAGVRESITAEVQGLRTMMSELRPPALDEGGLVSALTDYGAAFARRTSIECVVEATIAGTEPLPPQVETIAYRVMQEALVNVERHSRASVVSVAVAIDDRRQLQLRVTDDGVGFDTSRMREFVRDEHFGLAGMQERVRCGGGTWSVSSAPGRGATILAALPLEAEAETRAFAPAS